MSTLILASASPRRKELLVRIGISPVVYPVSSDEVYTEKEPSEIVKELAFGKVSEAAGQLLEKQELRADTYLLGADTIVVCEGKILGKPVSEEDAARMLRAVQGHTHKVYTGVSILYAEEGDHMPDINTSFSVCTDVDVLPMTEEEIRAYIQTGEPMDKAGSYGIQGIFSRHISGIRGDYTNVVGLPVSAVYRSLRSMGFYGKQTDGIQQKDGSYL
ncbi:MAG: septum formation protein Maf [Eubacterium sp.]|nr:septum formation protein Maf [Eubacterium sp.]